MQYQYPITATSSGDADPTSLQAEVDAAALGTLVGVFIGVPASECITVEYDAAVDQGALDAVIAAHNGTSPFAALGYPYA
jgi:hypothetical protein